jgi:hypothetical protein
MCGAPERLSAFGALTFPTVITTSVVQDLIEKIAGVDCMMRWLSIALQSQYSDRPFQSFDGPTVCILDVKLRPIFAIGPD